MGISKLSPSGYINEDKIKSILQPHHSHELGRLQHSHRSPAHKILLQVEPGVEQILLLHSSAHPILHLQSLDFPFQHVKAARKENDHASESTRLLLFLPSAAAVKPQPKAPT